VAAWVLCLATIFVVGCSLEDFVGVRPSDAGADVTAQPDAPAASGDSGTCAHTFCDDFDHAPLGALWDAVPTSGFVIDKGPSTSPPNSLRIEYGNDRPASMIKSFPLATRIHLELDILLVTPPSDVAVSTLRPSNGDTYVTIEYRPTGNLQLSICVQAGCSTTKDIGPLVNTRFRHLAIDCDLKGGPVNVVLDSILVVQNAGPIPSQPANGVAYELGDSIPSSDPSSELRVDNVVIDAH